MLAFVFEVTLVLSPLLLGRRRPVGIPGRLIVFDAESAWLGGLALRLYVIIAASVWYGPPIQV